ncbi:MAG: hypothetical protein ACM31C_19025 [Acidobacteriota bacterium]
MRIALLGLLLAGCVQQDPYPPGGGGGGGGYYPPPPSGGDGGTSYGCTSDASCGSGNVCARTFECLPASEVYAIHVTWTLQGQAASSTTCATAPDLQINFTGTDGLWWGYAPVPCIEGKFSIDKMPIWYTTVQLERDSQDTTQGATAAIDSTTGAAALDLPY